MLSCLVRCHAPPDGASPFDNMEWRFPLKAGMTCACMSIIY